MRYNQQIKGAKMNLQAMTMKQLQKAFNKAMLEQNRELMSLILEEMNKREVK